jgi:hypothetical protein
MNKRIKELQEQAFREADGKRISVMDKFAELVIKECILVVDEAITENQEINIGLVMASAKIVAHFGVEE